jgi:hypothetical protein
MTNLPQNVSSRYAYRLLAEGHNEPFELVKVDRHESTHDGLVVGHYYEAVIVKRILMNGPNSHTAAGASPRQAVERALQRAGVTFV